MDYAKRLNMLYREICLVERATLNKIIQGGEWLSAEREKHPGTWGQWCADNLLFSQRTASNWLLAYEWRDRLDEVAAALDVPVEHLGLTDVLDYVAAVKGYKPRGATALSAEVPMEEEAPPGEQPALNCEICADDDITQRGEQCPNCKTTVCTKHAIVCSECHEPCCSNCSVVADRRLICDDCNVRLESQKTPALRKRRAATTLAVPHQEQPPKKPKELKLCKPNLIVSTPGVFALEFEDEGRRYLTRFTRAELNVLRREIESAIAADDAAEADALP
jgi:hypothetical protein